QAAGNEARRQRESGDQPLAQRTLGELRRGRVAGLDSRPGLPRQAARRFRRPLQAAALEPLAALHRRLVSDAERRILTHLLDEAEALLQALDAPRHPGLLRPFQTRVDLAAGPLLGGVGLLPRPVDRAAGLVLRPAGGLAHLAVDPLAAALQQLRAAASHIGDAVAHPPRAVPLLPGVARARVVEAVRLARDEAVGAVRRLRAAVMDVVRELRRASDRPVGDALHRADRASARRGHAVPQAAHARGNRLHRAVDEAVDLALHRLHRAGDLLQRARDLARHRVRDAGEA